MRWEHRGMRWEHEDMREKIVIDVHYADVGIEHGEMRG